MKVAPPDGASKGVRHDGKLLQGAETTSTGKRRTALCNWMLNISTQSIVMCWRWLAQSLRQYWPMASANLFLSFQYLISIRINFSECRASSTICISRMPDSCTSREKHAGTVCLKLALKIWWLRISILCISTSRDCREKKAAAGQWYRMYWALFWIRAVFKGA